jgi:hypothetical protein
MGKGRDLKHSTEVVLFVELGKNEANPVLKTDSTLDKSTLGDMINLFFA